MKVTVIGCGRWGTFLAWYAAKTGHAIKLYGRDGSAHMKELVKNRANEFLKLGENVVLTTDLKEAVSSDVIIIAINSQGLRNLLTQLKPFDISEKIIVLCMKGIEISSGKRLSQIAAEYLDGTNSVAVWLGPGHVQELYNGIPNCMVIDSLNKNTKEILIRSFSSGLIRFYYGNDMVGNEVGAAAKNTIGIAGGMLDGLGLSSLKGALISRGPREIARLIKAMGGNEMSAYGLCHLGDYEATVFSEFSHNRRYGESIITGKEFYGLAEGYYTTKALLELSEKYSVEMPICKSVYNVLYLHKDPASELKTLFLRDQKQEFYI